MQYSHLSERVELTVDEAEFGMETWLAFPDRLVGYVGPRPLLGRAEVAVDL